MFPIVLIACTVFLLGSSLKSLIQGDRPKQAYLPIENALLLITVYATVLTGFGMIYILLEINGFTVLSEAGSQIEGTFLQLLETGMYFSAVTLFSVGYGDITPVGTGRAIAVIEAMIGYIMPAAFLVRTVFDNDKYENQKQERQE
ncbi:potassium channel family protein [Bacillus marinisedimentorum]|uniref:potassium channel family protein n=1 Tax=Bacillus marinisedimentorum TaxID=1821260 RepID=UPI0007E193EF|nr:potassium channel family protein [Bacillus marinisedimentorum]